MLTNHAFKSHNAKVNTEILEVGVGDLSQREVEHWGAPGV